MPVLNTKRAAPDEKLEEFHLWTRTGDRKPSKLLLIVAASIGVALLLGLAYLARAVL